MNGHSWKTFKQTLYELDALRELEYWLRMDDVKIDKEAYTIRIDGRAGIYVLRALEQLDRVRKFGFYENEEDRP